MRTAHRVVARFLAANGTNLVERIEAIPGWDRVNFLRSVHDQAQRGRAISPKQLAVVEKIEAERGKPKLSPDTILMKDQRGFADVLRALRTDGFAKVYDPRGAITKGFLDRLHRELVIDFEGQVEQYAELNADEDDPKERAHNSRMMEKADKAGTEMASGQVVLKDGMVVATPSPVELRRKYLDR